jgi:hypothetical protein
MNLFSQIASVGLNTKARFTSANLSGTPQVGGNAETVSLPDADVAYTFDMLLIGAATDATVELVSNTDNDDFAWVAGTRQVETATAAGTISAAGNASVVVTAAGMTGSPKTISVAVANSDTAATWAGKVRTALAADTAVSALFDVGGTTTAISLTRKATATYTVGTESIPVYPANDGTLNISLDNGTCTGITTAATSANTTSGVATSGVYAPDCDGKDFEGVAIPAGWDLLGILIKGTEGDATASLAVAGLSSAPVGEDDYALAITSGTTPAATGDLVITTGSANSVVTVTVIGQL